MQRFKNTNNREHVWHIGNLTIRVSRSQFAVYNGYESIINWQW